MPTEARFLASSGRQIFTGNEMLVKGALEIEGGIHLMTGYPGSPVAGFFDCLSSIGDLLKDKGIRAFQSNNEALGVAAINGSQMYSCRSIVAFKSVGTHVGSDALALGNLAGAHPEGGALVISGDDPWCDSTQVAADSRFLFEHLRMPVVEPGTFQELKDWVGLSFKLSQAGGCYIGYIVTTAQADGGASVECAPNHYPTLNENQKIALDTKLIDLDKVLLPPRTWQHELQMTERMAKTIAAARLVGINRIDPARQNVGSPGQPNKAPMGFVVTGVAGPYLDQVLDDLGLSGVFPILRMGLSYPADIQMVVELSQQCQQIIVIEERRSFLEKGIRDRLFHELPHDQAADLSARLYGKRFPGQNVSNGDGASSTATEPDANTIEGIPDVRGLSVSLLAEKLIPLFKHCQSLPEHMRNGRLTSAWELIRSVSRRKLNVVSGIVDRTPTFCPGCPHRDSSAVLLELRKNLLDPAYMKKHHNRGPVDLLAHGDTGCYTMLMFAPTEELMHNYSGMGLGGGTGSGIDPFITNKQIVFMGDSTFFHSGQLAISNAIKANQDITFIILENKTTAMTGHQEHPGTEVDLMGNRSYIQDIYAACKGMAGTSPLKVTKLRPDKRKKYYHTLESNILADGVKVVIADKECGITFYRKVHKAEREIIKQHGYLPRKTHMNVTLEVCEDCLECTKGTACPGLIRVQTDYGPKIDTDLTWCVNDGACERVRVSNDHGTNVKPCPSFEQVTVVRRKRRRYRLPHMGLDKLPDPTPVHDLSALGSSWRVHMAGVGGMGIGLVGAILVRAGHKEGYGVAFQDKKGLAIRNGGVYSQITFVNDQADQQTDPEQARQLREKYAVTGNIPYGQADLLLGIDILEASRAVNPRDNFRIGSPTKTAAVLNSYRQPTVYNLLGEHEFDPEQLCHEIYEHCNQSLSYSKNISSLCEQRLGSKQFVNILMLGVAYQLGLVPVSAHAIAWAIRDTLRRDHRRNMKAFNIGRKLAMEPRALPAKPQPETWDQLLTNKSRILKKTRLRGQTWAGRYEQLVRKAVAQMPDLPEGAKYDLALRIYDLMQYANHHLSADYIQRVQAMYQKDSLANQYAATIAVIWNLARVRLIKDEPYVSYLLTRYEKKQRDILKYGVDIENGDKLLYRHHTNPEFTILGRRIRIRMNTSDWQLKIVKHMKWWRRLPGWHRRETSFRDWYTGLLDRVNLTGDYKMAVQILLCPEVTTGYREVRYPKMERVRQQVDAVLNGQAGAEVPRRSESELYVGK